MLNLKRGSSATSSSASEHRARVASSARIDSAASLCAAYAPRSPPTPHTRRARRLRRIENAASAMSLVEKKPAAKKPAALKPRRKEKARQPGEPMTKEDLLKALDMGNVSEVEEWFSSGDRDPNDVAWESDRDWRWGY